MAWGPHAATTALLVAVAALGVGACSDDDEAPVRSQDEYDLEASRLCERHGDDLDTTFEELNRQARSDAERVALLRSEFVPRGRAIIRGLDAFGTPADRRAEYVDAYNRGLVALQVLVDDTYELLDRAGRGALPADEDPLAAFRTAFADADIPC